MRSRSPSNGRSERTVEELCNKHLKTPRLRTWEGDRALWHPIKDEEQQSVGQCMDRTWSVERTKRLPVFALGVRVSEG